MALNHRMLLAVIAVTMLPATPALANDYLFTTRQQGDISYVSGGIGKDEREALQATQNSYNLRILNADKSGHLSGNSRLFIRDAKNNLLLDAISGPIFYANLPKGTYVVEGQSQEQIKTQRITIANGKPTRVRFMWAEDASDTAD